jgi:hypothetical protein
MVWGNKKALSKGLHRNSRGFIAQLRSGDIDSLAKITSRMAGRMASGRLLPAAASPRTTEPKTANDLTPR